MARYRRAIVAVGIAAVSIVSIGGAKRVPAAYGGESGANVVPLPTTAPPEGAAESRTILETGNVRLVTLTVRRGQKLAPRSAEGPVLIHALVGSGKVVIGSKEFRVASDSMVVLAQGVEHAVEADGEDLVLLVEHVKVPSDGRNP